MRGIKRLQMVAKDTIDALVMLYYFSYNERNEANES